ncbi:hypothetical protein PV08_06225 [Exophiala spinifera]|uniref:Uncharacterized protein n=1 Tax=Exophiala spinifera TaxID=91928 RepID=A0A0D2BXZ9_9EURO|nr:uncharacterized protein PV08_06225 [Exophiala spinifera]KIW16174.1 hypothetical protein PV08_06225 [Exophiala spinifera]
MQIWTVKDSLDVKKARKRKCQRDGQPQSSSNSYSEPSLTPDTTWSSFPPCTATTSSPAKSDNVPVSVAAAATASSSSSSPSCIVPSDSEVTGRYYSPANQLYESSPEILAQFSQVYDLFMLGPTFAEGFRAAIRRSFFSSPGLLKDIFEAMYSVVMRAKDRVRPYDEADIAVGAAALQKLRTVEVGNVHDALAVNALGQTLAAFDLLTSCNDPSLILRYSLLSVAPWYGELSRDPALDPFTITSIFWDTVSCLLRREVPVLRYTHCTPTPSTFVCRERDHADADADAATPTTATTVIERSAGLCTTLLPILYDLCVASKELDVQHQCSIPRSTGPIRLVEQSLRRWTPDLDALTAVGGSRENKFSLTESLEMQSQAVMYRLAALLLVHRIWNPIGSLDDTATHYAQDILDEMSRFRAAAAAAAAAATPPSPTPPAKMHNVAFPLLVASLEIAAVPKDIWQNVSLSSFAPLCVTKIQALIEHVWAERRRGSREFMLDLISTGPNFMVVP